MGIQDRDYMKDDRDRTADSTDLEDRPSKRPLWVTFVAVVLLAAFLLPIVFAVL